MINPGDQIYIPGERDTPARTSLEVANSIVGIVAAITGITTAILYFIYRPR